MVRSHWLSLALVALGGWVPCQVWADGGAVPSTRPPVPEEIPGQVPVADVIPYGSKPEPSLVARAETELSLAYPLGQLAESMDPWGWRYSEARAAWRMHTGVDLAAPMGTPVLATLAGKVLLVGVVSGYGNTVLLDHGNGVETLYAHLQQANVQVGEQLEQGAVLGAVGMSGAATGPHLHFELRQRDAVLQALDPTSHLPPLMAPPMVANGLVQAARQ